MMSAFPTVMTIDIHHVRRTKLPNQGSTSGQPALVTPFRPTGHGYRQRSVQAARQAALAVPGFEQLGGAD